MSHSISRFANSPVFLEPTGSKQIRVGDEDLVVARSRFLESAPEEFEAGLPNLNPIALSSASPGAAITPLIVLSSPIRPIRFEFGPNWCLQGSNRVFLLAR